MINSNGLRSWQVSTLQNWVTLAFIVAIQLMISHAVLADASLIVSTTSGAFQGQVSPRSTNSSSNVVYRWLGIPYAAAPTGQNRWRSPQPYELPAQFNATTVRNATAFSASCMQYQTKDASALINASISEDCLYLNVWSPFSSADVAQPGFEPAAVMVWIYGGGFWMGSTTLPEYEGTRYVAASDKKMIVVTLNYRLGAWGFMAAESLNRESGARNSSGNYGIEDQRAALQWVRANIRAFGGDPNRVTMAGESAGAMSVALHMLSPMSAGLFHAAIMQSGELTFLEIFQSSHDKYQPGRNLAAITPCGSMDNLACMRNLTTQQLHDSLLSLGAYINWMPNSFAPSPDNYNFPSGVNGYSITERFRSGSFFPVPVLLGTNVDEAAISLIGNPSYAFNFSKADYDAAMPSIVSNDPKLLSAYAAQNFKYVDAANPYRIAYIRALTDRVFTCPVRRAARYFSAKAPAFLYSFAHHPLNGVWGNLPWMGAWHYAEVMFAFNNPDDEFGYVASFTPAEASLSTRMQQFWINFVITAGNPNGGFTMKQSAKVPQWWPAYTSNTDERIVFETGSAFDIRKNMYQTECDLWDSIQVPSSGNGNNANGNTAVTNINNSDVTASELNNVKGVAIAALILSVVGMLIFAGYVFMKSRMRQQGNSAPSTKQAQRRASRTSMHVEMQEE
jgi:para-nitrobenzyl esterase